MSLSADHIPPHEQQSVINDLMIANNLLSNAVEDLSMQLDRFRQRIAELETEVNAANLRNEMLAFDSAQKRIKIAELEKDAQAFIQLKAWLYTHKGTQSLEWFDAAIASQANPTDPQRK